MDHQTDHHRLRHRLASPLRSMRLQSTQKLEPGLNRIRLDRRASRHQQPERTHRPTRTENCRTNQQVTHQCRTRAVSTVLAKICRPGRVQSHFHHRRSNKHPRRGRSHPSTGPILNRICHWQLPREYPSQSEPIAHHGQVDAWGTMLEPMWLDAA